MSWKIYALVFCLSVSCYAGPVENVETQPQVPQAQEETAAPAAVQESVQTVNVPKEVVTEEKPSERTQRSYVHGNDVKGSSVNQVEESLLRKLNSKCAQRDASSCAMLKLVTYMNRLLKKANIDVADNIEITQTSTVVEVKAEDLPRSINEESEESQLAELMTAKLLSFVRSRALRLRLVPTMEAVLTSNPDAEGNLNLGMSIQHVKETEEGRGKKGGGGLIAALVMKFGMLGALAFKGLVLLVGKALLVSKIALLLAVVIGLKKLFSHQKHVTYEVVAQPHHSHAHVEHDHGHGGGHDSYSSGWGRTLDVAPVKKGDGQNIAYSSYAPKH